MFADQGEKTKVKICGITNLEDARFTAGALADYLGFIFYEKSPRYIEPAKAGAIINWIEGPETVGVFVNEALDDLNRVARQTGIDMVQLHGNESADYCQLVEKPVIKVFHIKQNMNAQKLADTVEPYLDIVDYLLFDTSSETQWGGTGKRFDWTIMKNLNQDKPFFLSGGLHTENVREGILTTRPFAVDLSSGVEKVPGIKDFKKIESFFDEMRDIWDHQETGKCK